MKRFIIQLGVLSVFIDTKIIFPSGTFVFDFYDYYFIFFLIILYYIFENRNLKILPIWFIKGFGLFLIGSIIGALFNDYISFPFIKTIIGIIFSAISYYLVIKIANYDIHFLTETFLKSAFFISILGITQELLALSGTLIFFGPVAKAAGGLLYRVSSTSGEPYFLSTVLLPALIYYSYLFFGPTTSNKMHQRKYIIYFLTTFVCFALTFSTAGFFAFFVGVLIITINKARIDGWGLKTLYFPLFAFIIYSVSTFISEKDANYNRRVNDTLFVLKSSDDTRNFGRLNSSSFSLTSNYYILKNSFSENPIFGTGVGTYEFIYNLFFDKIFGKEFRVKYMDQNSKDGNSLFIRLLAETGLWGFFIFLFYVLKNSTFNITFWKKRLFMIPIIMNQAIFIFFLIRFLRTGNYIGQGFFFFFFLYFYNHKTITQNIFKEK